MALLCIKGALKLCVILYPCVALFWLIWAWESRNFLRITFGKLVFRVSMFSAFPACSEF